MKSLKQQFLDFCRAKPVDEAYDYWSFTHCAVMEFAKLNGYVAEENSIGDAPNNIYNLHDEIRKALCNRPHNYGALTKRLERRLAELASLPN